jgi:hypothetical protein
MRQDEEDSPPGGNKERIGTSVEGKPILAWVLPGDGQSVLVIGGIHGDEVSSAQVVLELRDELLADPEIAGGRRVVLIPAANPDGLRLRTRGNSSGIDLNRNFPAPNFQPGPASGPRPRSEPETRAVLHALRKHDPLLVVAVHAPLACVDPDGGPTAKALARRIARAGRLPVKDLEAFPGSLGSHVSLGLGRSIITYELERNRLAASRRKEHVQALIVAIQEAGRLE